MTQVTATLAASKALGYDGRFCHFPLALGSTEMSTRGMASFAAEISEAGGRGCLTGPVLRVLRPDMAVIGIRRMVANQEGREEIVRERKAHVLCVVYLYISICPQSLLRRVGTMAGWGSNRDRFRGKGQLILRVDPGVKG